MRYEIILGVEADHEPSVRDLADAIREGVKAAQRGGQHPEVTLGDGPTVRWLGAEGEVASH